MGLMRRKDCTRLPEGKCSECYQIASSDKGSLPSEPEWFQPKPARKPTVIQAAVSLVLVKKNERI